MQTLAGPGAEVHFTHLSHASCASLSKVLSSTSGNVAEGVAHHEGILDVLSAKSIPLSKVCLLDPKAPDVLSPEDGDAFEYYLFGVRMLSGGRVLGSDRHVVVITMSSHRAYSVRKLAPSDPVKLNACKCCR